MADNPGTSAPTPLPVFLPKRRGQKRKNEELQEVDYILSDIIKRLTSLSDSNEEDQIDCMPVMPEELPSMLDEINFVIQSYKEALPKCTHPSEKCRIKSICLIKAYLVRDNIQLRLELEELISKMH